MNERIRLGRYLQTALTLGDFAVINLAYLLVCALFTVPPVLHTRLVWLALNVAFIPTIWISGDVHRMRKLYADRVVLQALKCTALYGVGIAVLFYVLKVTGVRLHFGAVYMGFVFWLLAVWWLIAHKFLRKLRRMGFNYKRVVVVGAGDTAKVLVQQIRDPSCGYRLMGVFSDNKRLLENFGDFYCAPLEKVKEYVRGNRIELIFLTIDASKSEPLADVMRTADELGVEFIYVPGFPPALRDQFVQSQTLGMPVLVHSVSPLTKPWNAVLKRVFDLALAVPVCLLSPLWMLPVAIGIKMTSPGPIFFRQKRTGMRGDDFICYKFRTMRVNADADRCQATQDDPRKTRFGNFLRRTSIDELPQFFNVLLGNMSVVGPRPHMVSQTDDYRRIISKYMIRHAVKPGISGWAQVNGYRGGTRELWQMERRVEYDVWYIHHWNLFLDIKIVFLTVFNALRGESNAY